MLSPVLDRMDDPNTTPMEAAALGREASSQIANVLNLGFKAQDQESERARLMQDAAYKNAQLRIAQQNANSRAQSAIAAGNAPPATIDMPLGDGSTKLMQWDGASQSYVPARTSGLGGTTQTAKGDDLISLVKDFEKFEPKAYNDYKQTSVGYGTKGKPGEVLTEEQASERLQSELFGHAKRIEDAAELKGITLNKNQFNALTSFDFNTGKGANLIERFGDDPQQLASKILEYNKAGGEVKGGLVKRRQIEAALFLAPEQQAAEAPQVTPQNQGGIGFTPAKVEVVERAMTDAERITANLPAGQYMAKFTGDKPSNIKQLETPPDSLERLKENRMLKADDRISALIESTDKGAERLINMNEALSLLNSGEVKSGSLGSIKVAAKRLFGMDVASEEQFNSLVGNLALEAIDLTKGAISDREMTFFREELAPGINKSVLGNKRIIEFKIAAAKRGLRINQVAKEMLANNALPADIEAAINKIQKEESLIPSNTTDQSAPDKPQSATDRFRAKVKP